MSSETPHVHDPPADISYSHALSQLPSLASLLRVGLSSGYKIAFQSNEVGGPRPSAPQLPPLAPSLTPAGFHRRAGRPSPRSSPAR